MLIKKSKNKIPSPSLSARMRAVGLNPKTEFLFVGSIDLLLVGFSVFSYLKIGSPIASLLFLASTLFFSYFALTRYARLRSKQDEALEEEFVQVFTYFGIYVSEGLPVYNALEETIKFASAAMAERLRKLLLAIDSDKSLVPFLAFAESFKSLTIRQVMISIYKMVDEGSNGIYLRQFATIFQSLADDKRKQARERRIEQLGNLCFLPLLGSGVTMGMITVALVEVIGELSNGL
jgi:hypothetical protein